jgi:anti-anti-sigma regulatory factor
MMEELHYGDLVIRAFASGDHVSVIWSGTSDEANPATVLSTYFSKLIPSLQGHRVTMDFRPLRYMNSVTVGSLITVVKALDAAGVKTNLVYDRANLAQRVSFQCMKNFSATMAHITVG